LEGAAALTAQDEAYENFGTVHAHVQDMHPLWERKKNEVQVTVTPKEELYRVATHIAMPPEQVWNFLVQAEHFNVLVGGDRMEIAGRDGGRVSVGSVYQCYHGDHLVPLTVLEWQPFKRIVTQFVSPVPIKGTTGLTEIRLEPTERGTQFTQIFSKGRGPLLGRLMSDNAMRKMRPGAQTDVDNFKAKVEADFAQRGVGAAVISIPEAMVAAEARASLTAA
jgi:uncharacterized protein YndB with AHSA1/START domain